MDTLFNQCGTPAQARRRPEPRIELGPVRKHTEERAVRRVFRQGVPAERDRGRSGRSGLSGPSTIGR